MQWEYFIAMTSLKFYANFKLQHSYKLIYW